MKTWGNTWFLGPSWGSDYYHPPPHNRIMFPPVVFLFCLQRQLVSRNTSIIYFENAATTKPVLVQGPWTRWSYLFPSKAVFSPKRKKTDTLLLGRQRQQTKRLLYAAFMCSSYGVKTRLPKTKTAQNAKKQHHVYLGSLSWYYDYFIKRKIPTLHCWCERSSQERRQNYSLAYPSTTHSKN